MRCSNCGLGIDTFPGVDPPRCAKKGCNAILCNPDMRDCAFVHWRVKHGARKVQDISGPGLDRLTPSEKRNYEEGAWAVES